LAVPGVAPFTLDHFRSWAFEHELDNDEPWVLEEFEERFAADVFSGIPICWLVVPEGNGKTTFVAGLALYIIEHKPSAYVPVAASARDQAEWIYRQAEGLVYRSDRRREFKCLEGYRRIRCDGMGSRIQVFAADDRSGDGIIPGGIAVLDELHRHRDLGLYETWKGKLRKRNAQLVVISTAGEVGGEFELERERLRQSSSEVDRDGCFVRAVASLGEKRLSVLHDYAVPEDGDIDDLVQVKAANPASYVTIESLLEKRAMVRNDQHWSRFTCNRASRGTAAAITEAEWFGAAVDEEIPVGVPVWLGLDVAWKWDTTAAVPLWVRDDEFRLLGPASILTPPRNGNSLDPNLVEKMLLDIHARNPVHTVVMDTSSAEQLGEWIGQHLNATVVDRQQTNPLAVLDYDRFMEALRMGWLFHTGDPGLTQHALNAVARILPLGDARFDRPHQSRRDNRQQDVRVIDALVAAAMAHSTAFAEVEPLQPVGFSFA
jgi:phage terminase large subunit-like protein